MLHKNYKKYIFLTLLFILSVQGSVGYCITSSFTLDRSIINSKFENIYEREAIQDTVRNQKADSVLLDSSKLKVGADSVLNLRKGSDTLALHSVVTDSLLASDTLRAKTFKSDTMLIKGGVLPIMREKFLDEQSLMASKFDTLPKEKLGKKEREKLMRDSLKIKSFSETVGLSFLLPGYGQIKNKQAWKVPILYATTGTLAYLTVNASHNFKKYSNAYDNARQIGVPQEHLDRLLVEKNKYSTQKTLFMAGTAASYLYFVGDAAINYKGEVHPTRKATILSAIFPGAGQIYNKSYWKLPIIYGGFAAFGYIIDYNGRGYKRFKLAYQYLSDGDDSTVDEFDGYYSESFLQNTRDSYRRYRDLGVIMLCGFYLLNIVDAHVEAYLRRYDISDDLSLKIEPTMMSRPKTSSTVGTDGIGLSMKFNF